MADRPNIVLILADDMGYGDVSRLHPEGKIRTEHLDRMADAGMVFTDAHASSAVCTPSRYSILTGRYAWRGRLQRSVLGPHDGPLLEADRPTLPAFLRAHGYRTGCIGKWHLGMEWTFDPAAPRPGGGWQSDAAREASLAIDYTRPLRGGPVDRGFDTWFGVDVPNFPPYCWIEQDRTVGLPDRPKPDDMFGTPGAMIEGWDLEAIMPELTRRAVAFIETHAGDEQPFFLYFPLTGPHTPICPTAAFRGQSGIGIYGDWILQMDATVGAVNDALARTGADADTLVLFASDNGSPGRNGSAEAPGTVVETCGHNPNGVLRGMKGDAWEGGHRVPLLAKWPGRIRAGARSDRLVCLMDLFATCADLLGADVPAGAAEDSVSLLPLLTGATDEAVRTALVHHSFHGLFAMRQDAWKYIPGPGSGGFSAFGGPRQDAPPTGLFDPPEQLYDLADDLREQHNLWGDRQAVVAGLAHALATCRFGPAG